MLFTKPIILHLSKMKQIQKRKNKGGHNYFVDEDDESYNKNFVNDNKNESTEEIFISQMIETIEFCLGNELNNFKLNFFQIK